MYTKTVKHFVSDNHLGKNVHGGKTVFNYGVNMNDIGKISHMMEHSHGRCVVIAFD